MVPTSYHDAPERAAPIADHIDGWKPLSLVYEGVALAGGADEDERQEGGGARRSMYRSEGWRVEADDGRVVVERRHRGRGP